MKDKLLRAYREYALRRVDHIQSLIDRGRPSRLTVARLNWVCWQIQKLDALLKEKPDK